MTTMTVREAIIYLRLSDFRDEDDLTFDVRETELRDLALTLGLNVVRVVIENDLDGNGKTKGASAYKTPVKVTANGLTTFRTDRPEFASVLRQLQAGRGLVLIVGDDSRLSRNGRDGEDLIDACRIGGASVVVPDDEGEPKWILTRGGTVTEVDALRDRINDARRYSADVARKVRKGRRRWAAKSYQGGRRPFGYTPDPDAPEHRKTLVTVEAEAGVIGRAADDILSKSISLKAIARDLRDGDVPTVTGTAWSAETLRAVLIKPSVAGLAVRDGELVRAEQSIPEPILDRDVWERLAHLLTDPSRRTNTSRANEPRWLVSGFATCGVCGGPLRAGGGRDRAYAYIGNGCCHVRRNAAKVDEAVSEWVITLLERPEAAGLLRPEPRPEVDAGRLRAEAAAIRGNLDVIAGDEALGLKSRSQVLAATRRGNARLAEIAAELAAAADEPDPLPEFRGRDPREVWPTLPMARRRAVVQRLIASIVIKPTGRTGPRPEVRDTLDITPRPDLGLPA
jgi:DNA invertase Pin-like site-specific DNA recombinase